jgi:hypothetical protein
MCLRRGGGGTELSLTLTSGIISFGRHYEGESFTDILNLQVEALYSRILTQPLPPSDPQTLTPHPSKCNTLDIKCTIIVFCIMNAPSGIMMVECHGDIWESWSFAIK